MSKPTINFLKQRRLTLSKFEKKDRQLFQYVLIGFSVNLVIFIAVLGFNLYIKSQVSSLEKQQKQVEGQILENEEVETKFLIFTNKLTLIRELFTKRNDKQKAINYFSNLFSDNIFISGISYSSGTDSLLSLRLTSNNVFSLDEAFDKLGSDEVKQEFSSINKSALQRNDQGEYSLQIMIGLDKKQKTTAGAARIEPQTTNTK